MPGCVACQLASPAAMAADPVLADQLAANAAADDVPLLRLAPELHAAERMVVVRAVAQPRPAPLVESLRYHYDFADLEVVDGVQLVYGDLVLCTDGSIRRAVRGPWPRLDQYDGEPLVAVREGERFAGSLFRRTMLPPAVPAEPASAAGVTRKRCPVMQGQVRCELPAAHERGVMGVTATPHKFAPLEQPAPAGRSVDELVSVDVRGHREVTIATRDLATVYLEPEDCGADGCERGYVLPTNDPADRFPCARCGGQGAAFNADAVRSLPHLWTDPGLAGTEQATCLACGTTQQPVGQFSGQCPVRVEAAAREAARGSAAWPTAGPHCNAPCVVRTDEPLSPADVQAVLADYEARHPKVCGHRNPDYPDLACTYPAGHGLVPPEGDPTHDGMDHGNAAAGAWWSAGPTRPEPARSALPLTADGQVLRDTDGDVVALASTRAWATALASITGDPSPLVVANRKLDAILAAAAYDRRLRLALQNAYERACLASPLPLDAGQRVALAAVIGDLRDEHGAL